VPKKGSARAAGHDLYSNERTDLPARGQAIVGTGIAIGLPHNTYGRIAPRSSLAVKHPSAKDYCASGALPLRQDPRWANLAPLTLVAPDAVLQLSLTPGTSGGTVAIQTYLWTLVATQSYILCFRMQLTQPSYLLIQYSFIQPPEHHWSISRCGFPAIPLDWKGGTLGTNDWLSEEATVCFILIFALRLNTLGLCSSIFRT